MAVTLLLAFLIGRVRLFGEESTSVATTAIVVLATNAVSQEILLWSRLLDTCVGVAIGLVVNLVVWPPLRDRAAWSHAARLPRALGEVLVGIAEDIGPDLDPDHADTLLRRARKVDVRIDESWGLLRQAQESGRFNPRQRQRREHVHELETMLHLLEQAVAETQSMVRTIAISADQSRYWDEDFRSRWCALLSDTGEAVGPSTRSDWSELRTELQRLARRHVDGRARRRPVARVRRPDRQPAQRHRRGVPGRVDRSRSPPRTLHGLRPPPLRTDP